MMLGLGRATVGATVLSANLMFCVNWPELEAYWSDQPVRSTFVAPAL